MKKRKLIQSGVFLVIGVTLFWYVYKDIDVSKIKSELGNLTYGWIILSLVFNLLSQLTRALRWKKLIVSMDYHPGNLNLFLSVLVMAFTNLVIPRGGEIARCGVITKYDKVPFTKLVGTVFIERITDFAALIFLFLVLIAWQFPVLKELFQSANINITYSNYHSKIIIYSLVILFVFVFIFVLYKLNVFKKFRKRIHKIKTDFIEGFKTIASIKGKGVYIFQTFLIYFFWLMMLYVMFFAYGPTEELTLGNAAFAFAVSTFAFILPIQAGIGAWHYVVIQCLLLFGISSVDGMVFALLSHTCTNLVYLLFGAIALIILPMVNKN
ncbi:MAG: glycosyltransferase 2 family protein [Bacteroidales bacterium]|nr:glycosyltransferase 2 family protein [Bacteroidales bacterium]